MSLRILELLRGTVKRYEFFCSSSGHFARLLIYSKVAAEEQPMKPARHITSTLILIVPIAFLALQARPQATPVEEEIKAFEQQANAAYEANDLAKYFSFYAPDFSQFLPEGRTDLPEYQREREAYAEGGDRGPKGD